MVKVQGKMWLVLIQEPMKNPHIYRKWRSMAQSTRNTCRCASSEHVVRNCPLPKNDTGNNRDMVYSVTHGIGNNKKCFKNCLL